MLLSELRYRFCNGIHPQDIKPDTNWWLHVVKEVVPYAREYCRQYYVTEVGGWHEVMEQEKIKNYLLHIHNFDAVDISHVVAIANKRAEEEK